MSEQQSTADPQRVRAMQHVAARVVLAMRSDDPAAATEVLAAYARTAGAAWARAVTLTCAKLAADKLTDDEAARLAAAYAEQVTP